MGSLSLSHRQNGHQSSSCVCCRPLRRGRRQPPRRLPAQERQEPPFVLRQHQLVYHDLDHDLSTATFCYTGTPTVACGRKKRSILEDPLTGTVENLKPSSPARHAREVPLEASEDNKKASSRNAKLFLLLTSTSTITATATSTTTAYTGTATISVLCTPSGMSACG